MNYSWGLAIWQGLFVTIVSYWILRPLSSGVAAAVSGLAAALMAVRAEKWGRIEKIGWILIVTILVMVAIRSVQRERDQHDSEQVAIRLGQDKHFEAVLALNQRDFDATMTRITSLLIKETEIAETTHESLEQITGGRQFCYLTVLDVLQSGYSLAPVNSGPIPLTQCYVAIHSNLDPGTPGWPLANFQVIFARELGPLPPGPSRMLIKVPIVVPSGNYFIDIFTRDQMFTEFLKINPGYPKNGKPLETIEVRGGKPDRVLYKSP